MAKGAAAEMPIGWHFSQAMGGAFVSNREGGGQYAITISLLQSLLASQGLAIAWPADRAVLDTLPGLAEKQLRAVVVGKPFRASHELRLFALAELARREPKGTKT
jgi:hypothetical protein